ncbi:MAG: GNAT family N-acetyltransferase [Rhodospirillaceae bacterium]|nr:GNAT family N-acetyltransferase [Rhodospirillaceae bacterium]
MDPLITIETLAPAAYARSLDELADLLHHCVAAGAPVGFLWPFSPADARAYFADLVPAVDAGKRIVIVAKAEGRIVGAMQLDLDMPQSQPHRAGGRKLLVHDSVRKRGVGTALMYAMEDEARSAGRTLVDFIAVAGGAPEKLYVSIGYTVAGVIPHYDRRPDGTPCDTAVLYKHLI